MSLQPSRDLHPLGDGRALAHEAVGGARRGERLVFQVGV
jgi:hypothetical protein